MVSFDQNNDSHEHIITINIQMAVIGLDNSLKCKFFVRAFKESTLWCYVSLFKVLGIKLPRSHKKDNSVFFWLTSTGNFPQPSYSMFSKATMSPCMSIWSYLMRRPSRSPTQTNICSLELSITASSSSSSMGGPEVCNLYEEIVGRVKYCIKGEENNFEKRTQDAREQGGEKSEVSDKRRNHKIIPVREKVAFKLSRRPLELFTLLNTGREQILPNIYNIKVISEHISPKGDMMESESER